MHLYIAVMNKGQVCKCCIVIDCATKKSSQTRKYTKSKLKNERFIPARIINHTSNVNIKKKVLIANNT